MSWWVPLVGGYGLAFVSGVGAFPDGPEEGFWLGVLIFGTIMVVAGYLAMVIA